MPAHRDVKKLESLALWMRQPKTIKQICARHRISERTAYHWIDAIADKYIVERIHNPGGKGFLFRAYPNVSPHD